MEYEDVHVLHPEAAYQTPLVSSMNFLNEAMTLFPEAISFASGRPPNKFLYADKIPHWLNRYVEAQSDQKGISIDQSWQALGQYASTNGIIQELIARYLEIDEGFSIQPENCIVTNGFQEALTLLLLHLARKKGSIITIDPTYVGLSGAAMIANVPVVSVRSSTSIATSIQYAYEVAKNEHLNPQAVYVIPDYSNPSGEVLSLDERLRLLEVTRELNLTVYEDTAYRMFAYDQPSLPSLTALDTYGHVVYLGTFAKIFMPGLRVGFLALKNRMAEQVGDFTLAGISTKKSFVSVLTSPVVQAILGGFLLDTNCRVNDWNAAKIDWCRKNRNTMVAMLENVFGSNSGVSWSSPEGGFFVVITLPFEFGKDELVECAQEAGVIVTPMSFFSPSGGFTNQIRLAFSNLESDQIRTGVARLGNHINYLLQQKQTLK